MGIAFPIYAAAKAIASCRLSVGDSPMKAKEQSAIERLNSEAAEHERNAGIIRGSMSSTPSPDDFQQAESMQRELNRAKDKRALAQNIINERVNQLTLFFQQQPDARWFTSGRLTSNVTAFISRRTKKRTGDTSWICIREMWRNTIPVK
jgi:hypothetical protein